MQQHRTEGLAFTKEPFIADGGPCRIESIQFSMMFGEEIMKAAEVQVYRARYYDGRGVPSEGGLLDCRMGPANKKASKCTTCHGDFGDCPGHYGYVNLALPVYNVGYMATILNILNRPPPSSDEEEDARGLHARRQRASTISSSEAAKPQEASQPLGPLQFQMLLYLVALPAFEGSQRM
ncbi:hypothetical protein Ddye_024985 [Dipteronia dyeriana]|uniref:DNA-directed RNA polymerase n=1 Tax=Dipteronia dyeriana TaxID=168575 RepID=A0AAD9TW15_9ROSI|nr:hypothetical protein Ddye_024985 [Dipteronia dyeriana]